MEVHSPVQASVMPPSGTQPLMITIASYTLQQREQARMMKQEGHHVRKTPPSQYLAWMCGAPRMRSQYWLGFLLTECILMVLRGCRYSTQLHVHVPTPCLPKN
jgi:hypothetical protein